jgi:serine protease Do
MRARILPLFSFNPHAAELRPQGHGTAFRIDPWYRCATAYHVIEDLFELSSDNEPTLVPAVRLAALSLPGIAFGRVPIPTDAWLPFSGSFSWAGVESPPLAAPRLRNLTELAVARISPPNPGPDGAAYLELDFQRWHPTLGETVLAVGFAKLDVSDDDTPVEDRPIQQYLYGSFGRIIDIERADGARARPWPIFRVDGDWPPGMSGGPVFNEAGHVVGIVSSGIGEDVGTATYFSGWDLPARTFGSVDPSNPGRFRCYAVFDRSGKLARCGQDEAVIREFGLSRGFADFGFVSYHPPTGEYVRF